MAKINLEKYFDNIKIKYYDPKIFVTILEDILGKDIDTIKIELDELKIVISAEQIVEYLNNKFEKEEPEVKARLENPKPRKPKENNDGIYTGWIEEEIEESTQRFGDELTAARYGFDSYTRNYFIIF